MLVNSFFTLLYPADPSLWAEQVGRASAMEAWLLQDKKGAGPRNVTETNVRYTKPLNVNEQDEFQVNLDPALPMPVLVVCPQPRKLELPGVEKQMKRVTKDFTPERLSTTGRWVQLEALDEINATLKEFRAVGQRA
ncbi:hypothetical protein BDW68DRAFT_181591 [Aspergillus falconensis]